MADEKKLTITGQNNRYLIKKAAKIPIKIMKNTLFCEEWMSFEYQFYQLMNDLKYNSKMSSCISAKINSYKQQDKKRNMYDNTKFITYTDVIHKLKYCGMICYYCDKPMKILYNNCRDNTQWTLDRLDNNIGHNTDNVVMSCLQCNLNRRKIDSSKFLLTKQLNIVKLS